MWYMISFITGTVFGVIVTALMYTSRMDDFEQRLNEEEALRQTMNSEYPGAIIADGFGSQWSKECPECGRETMVVVRPGKAQCMECG